MVTTTARTMMGTWTVALLTGPETIEGTLRAALDRASEQDGASVRLGDVTIASGDTVAEWAEARDMDGAEQLREGIEIDLWHAAVAAGWTMPYTIATDAGSQTISAIDATDAALRFAASEGWTGIESADDLAEHITSAGGWLTISDARSVVLRAGAR